MVYTQEIEITTRGRGFIELTAEIEAAVAAAGAATGVCSAFIRHTSASLVITENADPEVLRDLERFMARLAVDGDALFRHDAEGPDDMAAHARSVLTRSEVCIPVRGGRIALGTWQGVFLWEHRMRAHRRSVMVTVIGEA